MNFLNDVFNTAQKMKFSIKDFFSKLKIFSENCDLVTFTEEILNAKLHFLCSVRSCQIPVVKLHQLVEKNILKLKSLQ